jgi:flagellar operon protein
MDLKKVQGFEALTPAPIGTGRGVSVPEGKGPSFRETLNQLSQSELTQRSQKANALPESLKFSQHAVDRMRTRGISFSQEDLGRISEAVTRAAAKGSKDSLILMKDSALIVSVKNKTVVTVMDQAALRENVFTNIDSTIVM